MVIQLKLKKLSYYLFIAGGGKKRWIHAFLTGISAKWNTDSSGIWTQVNNSIFYYGNRYGRSASMQVP